MPLDISLQPMRVLIDGQINAVIVRLDGHPRDGWPFLGLESELQFRITPGAKTLGCVDVLDPDALPTEQSYPRG